ncbi:MAG: sigma-70 family RNA polymerase sigma factor [Betaproteobacteria bacterium]
MSPDWTMPFSIDAVILPKMKSHLPIKPLSRSKARLIATPAEARQKTESVATASGKRSSKPVGALPSADDEVAFRKCLAEIAKQQQVALAKFYDLTVSRVYAVALRIVRRIDLAEEVVSDVYLQVWRDAHRYDTERGRVLGWLLIIARSRALDLLRRQDEAFSHPEPYDLVAEPESALHGPEQLLADAQAEGALHAALLQLTPLQRQLLSQAFFRGLSHQEIADQSGMPLGTVKTHIRRALGELRNLLGSAAISGDWS